MIMLFLGGSNPQVWFQETISILRNHMLSINVCFCVGSIPCRWSQKHIIEAISYILQQIKAAIAGAIGYHGTWMSRV